MASCWDWPCKALTWSFSKWLLLAYLYASSFSCHFISIGEYLTWCAKYGLTWEKQTKQEQDLCTPEKMKQLRIFYFMFSNVADFPIQFWVLKQNLQPDFVPFLFPSWELPCDIFQTRTRSLIPNYWILFKTIDELTFVNRYQHLRLSGWLCRSK